MMEYEDEGDLYLIQYDQNNMIYFWDSFMNIDYNKFPSESMEFYLEHDYIEIFEGSEVKYLGEKIDTIKLDASKKWKYLSKTGFPGHLETEQGNIEDYLLNVKNVLANMI